MKLYKVKQLLKLTEQEGVNQLLLLLLEYNQPDIHRNCHIVTLEEFTRHLQSQLPVDDKGSKQRDIEDLIDAIKSGKE